MQAIMANNGDHTLHTWGVTAVVFRAIIEIAHERVEVAKTLTNGCPPLGEAIGEAIAGDFGQDAVEKDGIRGGHSDAYRGHHRLGLAIVIGGMGLRSAFTPTGTGADCARGVGIDRNAQGL